MTKAAKRKASEESSGKPRAARWRELLQGAMLLAITFAAYSWLFFGHAGWIWDDPDYVLNNSTLRSLDGLRQMWFVPTSLPQWYPLVHTTFWIEYHLVGTHPLLYHFDNVLLHAISAILLWRLLTKLKVPGGFFAACVFAVHPVMVESVAWVTERKNVLSLVFYLLAMHVYLFRSGFGFRGSGVGLEGDAATPDTRTTKHDTRFYVLALVLFLCALFSKTVTASFPAAILLILWWKNGRLRLGDFFPLIPLFMAGIAMGAVTGYLEKHHVGADGTRIAELNLSFAQRCLIAGRAIWFYLGKILFPHPLTFIYPRWNEIDSPTAIQWIFPLLVAMVTLVLFALRNRIGRGVLVAWLLFCGTLVPALGFVNVYPMRFSFVADHFQYHASIAMIVLIVSAVSVHLAPRMRGAIWGVIIIVCAVLTWFQTHIYKNAEVLWRDTLGKNPNSWMVNTNLGNALAAEGKYDDAIPYHERALQLAPNLHDTHWNVGEGLMRRNDVEGAEREFRESLHINPGFAPGYRSLGQLYFYRRHDPQTAMEYYRKALEIAPGYAEANYYYGVALEQQANELRKKFEQTRDEADGKAFAEKLTEAIAHYRVAVDAKPDYLEAHYDLASCLVQLGQFDEAIANLRQAVRIKPDYAEAWTNLGNAFFQTHRYSEAADAFGKALAINQDLEPARRGYQAAKMRGG